jgi:hypothetical protein
MSRGALRRTGRQEAGRKTFMSNDFFNLPGELFLGSDRETALALGGRQFRSAAKAVAFAVEHAAPVSLRGAMLRIGEHTFERHQIVDLHRQLSQTGTAH